MDVPPPLRRPRLRKLRTALVATGAVVLALLLAWMPGRARVSVTCGVCGSSRHSDVVGLFWDDDPLVAVSADVHDVRSSSFIDTLGDRGHEHQWERWGTFPERFVADLAIRRADPDLIRCFHGLKHDSHADAAQVFNASPECRGWIAVLLDEKKLTLAELEDALLWCDDVGCQFSRHGLPQETADRRANAHATLSRHLGEYRRLTR